jgi:hypothetical protein
MNIHSRVVVMVMMGLAAGCGSEDYKLAPVSGTVYLNGKPQPDCHVLFQPIGTREHPNPGPGSYGATDANGRFTLSAHTVDKPGAVVGKHRVAISTIKNKRGENNLPEGFNPETGTPDQKVRPKAREREQIPDRYNDKTTLVFEVPPEGTDKAEFKLSSP